MNYSPDDFVRLMDEVERQGGTNLPDACIPDRFSLKLPSPSTGRMERTDQFTTGCRQQARFVVPYDHTASVEVPQASFSGPPEQRKMQVLDPITAPALSTKEAKILHDNGAGFVTACAIDDEMGLWPRFQKGI